MQAWDWPGYWGAAREAAASTSDVERQLLCRKLTKARREVVAVIPTKLMMGIVLLPLLYALVPALAWWWWGWTWALVVALALPLSGVATLRSLERGMSLRRIGRSARASWSLSAQRDALLARRRALEARVVEVVRTYIPADMVPLFPRDGGPPPPSSEG